MSKKCINKALELLPEFTEEDLEQYVEDVISLAGSSAKDGAPLGIKKAIKIANNHMKQQLFEAAGRKSRSIDKFNTLLEKVKQEGYDFKSFIIRRFNKAGDNLQSYQDAAQIEAARVAFDGLSEKEKQFMQKTENEQDIANAFDGKEYKNPLSKKIADNIKKYFEYTKKILVESDVLLLSQINMARLFKSVHDPSRMIQGQKNLLQQIARIGRADVSGAKDLWVNSIKQYYDMDRSPLLKAARKVDGSLDMEKVNSILKDLFDKITSESITDEEWLKFEKHMYLTPKDMRSLLQYNKLYGRGSLYNMLIADINATGRDVGLSKMFGDNPYNVYNKIKEIASKEMPRKNKYWNETKRYFDSIIRPTPSLASSNNFAHCIISLTSMSRMGMLPAMSLSDFAVQGSAIQMIGGSMTKTIANQIGHIFNLFPNEERRRIASLYKLQIDTQLGYMGRFSEAMNATDALSKMSNFVFKWSGMSAFDKGNKIGMMHSMAKLLYEQAGKSLSNMNPYTKQWVERFMSEHEWEVLRKKNVDKLFTVDNVKGISNEELQYLKEKLNYKGKLKELRSDLYRKVDAMFLTIAENGVLNAGAFEKSWLTQGIRPDTPIGILAHLIAQFKSYPIAFIDRVLVQGYKTADAQQRKLLWGLSLMGATAPLSALSMYLGMILNGQDTRGFDIRWRMMDARDKTKFFSELLMPSLAMFNSIADKNNENSNMIMTIFGSPSTRFLSNTFSGILSAAYGDTEKAKKSFRKSAEYLTPIYTMPVISPFIRQLYGDENYVAPGNKTIYGA